MACSLCWFPRVWPGGAHHARYGPLTELMGLNPEAAVTALQFANQTINTISPVAGMTVAGLAVARISFGQWWKTIWKFFIFMVVFGVIVTAISGMLPV
ncbi:MAG: hypothetical protein ACLTYW_03385 [Collinsella sp.]